MKTTSLVLTLLFARLAFAQGEDDEPEVGRVKVAVFFVAEKPLPHDVFAGLQRGLEGGLRKNPKIAVKDKDLLYAEFSREVPKDAVAEARALLRTGRELLHAERSADALLKLSAADTALENVIAFVKKSELAEAQFLRGVAELKTGDKRAARASFGRLVAWRPDYVVDVERFPSVLPTWEEARKQVARAGQGSLQITSEPEAAMAYVDGRYLGTTPVTASGLAAGDHYVTLRAEGYRRSVVKVTVDPKYDELVSESLPKSEKYPLIAERLAKVRGDLGGERASEALLDLRNPLGLDQAVVARVKREGSTSQVDVFLYDLRTGHRLSQVTGVKLTAATLEAKLDEVAQALYLNVRYDGKTTADLRAEAERNRPKAKPSGPSFYTRWWFWAIVGGVAVAGASPFVVGALLDDGPSCPGGHTCTELVWDF